MPVRKEPSGRRSVQAEVEVPGTPEQVWRAIATGPGVSSWFVPTEIEERAGGAITANFGPGMLSRSTIADWEPPRRFTAENEGIGGPGSPAMATEWTVAAQAGGTCVVRVVHSWFASSDDWDAQFEGTEHGWVAFFRILRLALTYFPDQPSAAFQVMGVATEPVAEAWPKLTSALGLDGAAAGERRQAAPGAPPFAAVVERVGPLPYPELLLRLDAPGPGLAHVFALPMGGQVFLPIRCFFYGEQATAAVAQAEPQWQAWIAQQFAPAAPAPAPAPA